MKHPDDAPFGIRIDDVEEDGDHPDEVTPGELYSMRVADDPHLWARLDTVVALVAERRDDLVQIAGVHAAECTRAPGPCPVDTAFGHRVRELTRLVDLLDALIAADDAVTAAGAWTADTIAELEQDEDSWDGSEFTYDPAAAGEPEVLEQPTPRERTPGYRIGYALGVTVLTAAATGVAALAGLAIRWAAG